MGVSDHPIVLERVIFTRSIVVAVGGHQPSEEANLTHGPENQINLAAIEGEPGRYQVTMRTTLNSNGDPADPYIIDMECIGLFTANDTLSPDEAVRGVMITAHSVLFGAIREAVAWITGRQPYGQLMLGLSVLQSKQPEKAE